MVNYINKKKTCTNFILSQKKKQKFVDIHCHCLPGIDDGPSTENEALELCRQMADEGITTAIATPHQLGRFEGLNKAVQIRNAVTNLNEKLNKNNIPINILPGAEVRIDQRLNQFLQDDEILTLADSGKYILLELPNDIFIDIDVLIQELFSVGIKSVIAHAERISQLIRQPEIINKWLEHSASLQITASSLTGDYGIEYKKNAWELLNSGNVSIIATDTHNTNSRKPAMRAAFEIISTKLNKDIAHLVCIENTSRIINGQYIVSASALNDREAQR